MKNHPSIAQILVFTLFIALTLNPVILHANKPTSVNDVLVTEHSSSAEIIVSISKKTDFKAFTLDNPSRLVIDVFNSEVKRANATPFTGDYIKKIRMGYFKPNQVRIVLDLSSNATIVKKAVNIKGDSAKIVISANFTKKSDKPEKKIINAQQKVVEGRVKESSIENNNINNVTDLAPLQSEPLKKTHKNLSVEGKYPSPVFKPVDKINDALKPIIVIDAGHGGVDPGAPGKKGYEKNVTLRFAQALHDALEETGKYKAVMTRQQDVFVKLADRVMIAKNANADLFISLHADAGPDEKARGLSVYTLSETASDKLAEALAENSNKSDLIAGVDLTGSEAVVANILIDLASRETMAKSSEFAEMIVDKAGKKIKLLNNPHRYAGFAVLKSPDIPSVLVELGFLTNSEDEELLHDRRHIKATISSLVEAIEKYFKINSKIPDL